MDGAIRKALAGQRDQDAGPCPDENLLAAYLELRLNETEREGVERHASNCVSCQETLGLALRLSGPEAEASAERAAAAFGKKVLFHIALPVSMVATVVLTLVAGFFFYRIYYESAKYPSAPQTAQLRNLPKAEEISAAQAPAANPPKDQIAPPEQRSAAPVPKPRKAEVRSAPQEILPPPAIATAPAHEPVPLAPPAPELAAPAAAQLLEAKAGGVASEKGAGIITGASENRPADGGKAGISPEMVGMHLGAARTAPAARVHAVAQFSAGTMPREAVLNLASLIPSGRGKLVEKKVADRIFYLNSGYWIDEQSAGHATAEFVEVRENSAEYEQILKSLPEVAKLQPAIIYWNGRNSVIRQVH